MLMVTHLSFTNCDNPLRWNGYPDDSIHGCKRAWDHTIVRKEGGGGGGVGRGLWKPTSSRPGGTSAYNLPSKDLEYLHHHPSMLRFAKDAWSRITRLTNEYASTPTPSSLMKTLIMSAYFVWNDRMNQSAHLFVLFLGKYHIVLIREEKAGPAQSLMYVCHCFNFDVSIDRSF